MTNSLTLVVATTLMLSFSSAQAQDKAQAPGAPKQKWVTACEGDVSKLCKEHVGGDVRPCLKQKEKELSPSCFDAFIKPYRVLELCQEDINTHCKDAQAAGGLGKCLNGAKDKLSDKCRSALVKGSRDFQKEKQGEAAPKDEAAPKEEPAPKRKAKRAKATS